ncbi:MAG: deoxynucleoside kinase, partial [Enterococcus thailandicus]|nr:deoxynucleoside kinase [Enterococcus thailandicus]
LIHIRVSFDTMLERIEKRGRSYEQLSFDPSLYDYYQELNRRYDQWYENYNESPKIQIDGDRYNFVEDPQAKDEVVRIVKEKLAEIRQEQFVY